MADERPLTLKDLLEVVATLKTELRTEIREVVAASESRLRDAIAASEVKQYDRMREAVRDAQTEVLKAFLPYQEQANVRMRALEAKFSNVDSGLSERMIILERRLSQIEVKLLIDPPKTP